MYKIICNQLYKLSFRSSVLRVNSRYSKIVNRNVYSVKNVTNNNKLFINKNYICTSRNIIKQNSLRSTNRRFHHQEGVKNDKIEEGKIRKDESEGENEANDVNGHLKEDGITKRERAMRRIKSRFQKIKTYIKQNKRVQNFKVYINQNKRIQDFKVFLRNSQRFQRFRSYATQKRQNLKGLTNKVKRREKLRELKKRFVARSKAFSILTVLTLKRYGKIGVFIYLSVYVATLAGMNAIVFMNYLTSEHVRKALNYFDITSLKVPDVDSPFAKFTVAYIATKLVEPLRLVVSVMITIAVTRILKR
ncbi:Conserved hypothetical protein [Theileria orientalis strain Shintoku]|uniref:DUF1279 domain-containing protein n=1 Tax=Theileria orientalis strain Shintoku TaxID=869250 RepID=J4D7U6_THEOR|nr:Conserved hypothetical protein [Theileria orientalis strain Shintoku]BAM40370.1 Conserved hypothetical protein [Theileria orientalis strain Shintoku]|eukprot:XP_009690671.1 Conserved hypothetical protein [Theileria orientalis strain Shintoku]